MSMKTSLEHLKKHVKYPTNKAQLVATCNNMSDIPADDRSWFSKTVPEGSYRGPEDVLKALLQKV